MFKKFMYGSLILGLLLCIIFTVLTFNCSDSYRITFIIFIIVSFLFTVIVPCAFYYLDIKNAEKIAFSLPEKQMSGKIISKEMISSTFGSNSADFGGEIETIHNYKVIFEITDSDRKVFLTNSNLYSMVLENDYGIITYKEFPDGSLVMIDFQRNA